MAVDNGLETIDRWLHTPTSVDRLFGIWPVLAGTTQTQPAYRNSRRVIPHHSLHVILSGTMYWSSSQAPTEAILGPGDVFCLFPEVTHQYRAMPSDPPRMVFVAVDGPSAQDMVEHLGLTREKPVLRGLDSARFLPHLNGLESAFTELPGRRALRPTEFLMRFVGEIVAATQSQPSNPGQTASLERARKFMDTHWTEGIRIEDVADHAGLSRAYFTKSFTRTYDISPRDYLWRKRLEHAQVLLRSTDLLIGEIAESVGYSDVYSFSHSYRRRFGVAPSAERDAAPDAQHDVAELPS